MKRMVGALLLLTAFVVPAALEAAPPRSEKAKLQELERLVTKLNKMEARTGPESSLQVSKTVVEVYDCADLTAHPEDFTHPNLLLRMDYLEPDDEAPAAGKEEEGTSFFGGVEDIMDLVVASVSPEVWKGGSTSIGVCGNSSLLVTAKPGVQKEVKAFLDGLRRSTERTVTVQVWMLRFPEGGASLPARMSRKKGLELLGRAAAKGGLELAASGRITGLSGQKVSLFGGGQQAFVEDYDVEVAQDADIADPVIGVLQTGLSFDVRAIAPGHGSLRLDLSGQFVVPEGPIRPLVTSVGDVQSPKRRSLSFAATFTLREGAFALVGAGSAPNGGRWVALVSARSDPITGGGAK